MLQGFLISPEQCRAARALLNWTQAELASRAGTIRANVVMFERGQTASATTRRRLHQALEAAGVMFMRADAVGGAGVMLRPTETKDPQPYVFDSNFYEAQARLIARVARHPAYSDLREGILSLSRDYYLQARHLSAVNAAAQKGF